MDEFDKKENAKSCSLCVALERFVSGILFPPEIITKPSINPVYIFVNSVFLADMMRFLNLALQILLLFFIWER